jgi:hypothetical protein
MLQDQRGSQIILQDPWTGGFLGGRCPPIPLGFNALGNQEGQVKKGRALRPCPSVIPRHGARVAPQRCPILRAGIVVAESKRQIVIPDVGNKPVDLFKFFRDREFKELLFIAVPEAVIEVREQIPNNPGQPDFL